MADLTLAVARTISDAALAKCREMKLKPMTIVVLDARGTIKSAISEDGASLLRIEVSHGKAYGALALGLGSRAIFKRATEQPYFVDAVNTLARGALVPVPGGVLINDKSGALLGAIGISGDVSDSDEAAAVAGIEAAGLVAVTG
jgi:uncharacterized protein GlcG (DUF336 family)